jgi:hypothetical protein
MYCDIHHTNHCLECAIKRQTEEITGKLNYCIHYPAESKEINRNLVWVQIILWINAIIDCFILYKLFN